jgi:hypothetical protein
MRLGFQHLEARIALSTTTFGVDQIHTTYEAEPYLVASELAPTANGHAAFSGLQESIAQGEVQQVSEENVEALAAHPTAVAVASGDWFDPKTWSDGRVPQSTDVAVVPFGVSVSLAGQANVSVLLIDGSLTFPAGELNVTSLIVGDTGTLTIHPSDEQVAQVTIRDAPIDTVYDPEQLGHGVLVLGHLDVLGEAKTPFIRLADEVQAGATTLTLTDVPENWRIGDKLALPDSRQLAYEDTTLTPRPYDSGYYLKATIDQNETVEIAAIDGTTITLVSPTQHSHLGRQHLMPHVANLSRNVRFVSENPEGVRGHLLALNDAAIDLWNAELYQFGRTTIAHLDNTTFNPDGTVAHIGTNQIGRYPVHIHHLHSNAPALSNGEQWNVVGNAIHGSEKWGIAIHDSHYGLVKNNVVYDATGSGIVFEEGNETGVELVGNFVGGITGSGEYDFTNPARQHDVAHNGSGFWLEGVNEAVISGNVAAGIEAVGFEVFVIRHFPNKYLPKRIPLFQGADLDNPSETITVLTVENLPPKIFADNEAYNVRSGMLTWQFLAPGGFINIRPVIWHAADAGIQAWYAGVITHVINPTILFDPSKAVADDANRPWYTPVGPIGISTLGTGGGDLDVVDGRIEGASIGISNGSARMSMYNNVYFDNLINIRVTPGNGAGGFVHIVEPRFAPYRNAINIQMKWSDQLDNGQPTSMNTVHLVANGKAYRLLYAHQSDEFEGEFTDPRIDGLLLYQSKRSMFRRASWPYIF